MLFFNIAMNTVEFDTRLRFPSTMIIMGVSGGGKTEWLRKMLKDKSSLLSKPIEKVLLCYGSYQPLYDDMLRENGDKLNLVSGCSESLLEQYDILNPSVNSILILDDLHDELANNGLLSRLFCKFSHHTNTMVIFVTQNLYHKGSAMRDTISNSHYLVCLAQPRDKTIVSCLARQMYPGNHKYLLTAYNEATSTPYGYLFVDARPETHANLRLRSGLFHNEQLCAWLPI